MPAHQTWSHSCEKMGMFTMLKRSAVDLVEKVKPLGRWKKNSKKSSFQAENLTSDAESVAEAKHHLCVKTMPHCQTQHLKIGTLRLFEKCFQYLTWFFFFFSPIEQKINKSVPWPWDSALIPGSCLLQSPVGRSVGEGGEHPAPSTPGRVVSSSFSTPARFCLPRSPCFLPHFGLMSPNLV